MKDLRVVAGFGMGTTKLDNDLIVEAFIMGAGVATGIISRLLDLDEKLSGEVASECLSHIESITNDFLDS
jgi:hypothetical protein